MDRMLLIDYYVSTIKTLENIPLALKTDNWKKYYNELKRDVIILAFEKGINQNNFIRKEGTNDKI